MKKLIFIYFVFSLAVIATAIFWFTDSNACRYIFDLPEGVSASISCPVDGPMTLGIFIESLIGATIYVAVSMFALRKLGFRITKDKK